jgi:hypothetical protein
MNEKLLSAPEPSSPPFFPVPAIVSILYPPDNAAKGIIGMCEMKEIIIGRKQKSRVEEKYSILSSLFL